MIRQSVTMSFEETPTTLHNNEEEEAAKALLSLAPATVKHHHASVNPAPPALPAFQGMQLPPIRSRPPTLSAYRRRILPTAAVGGHASAVACYPTIPAITATTTTEQSPKTVVHETQILNLPKLPSTGSNSATITSCESSLADGSQHSEWSHTHHHHHHEDRSKNVRYYDGTCSLALKEDEESLSPLHCFMRKYCVEAFTATQEDVGAPRYGKSHGRNVVVGQVGIQCLHCKHRSYPLRAERSVCFPSTLKNIYHSIETWQRRHSLVCTDIPAWAKKTMSELMGNSRQGAGGRRQYWEESALRLGMVDTKHGIRFIRPPGDVLPPPQELTKKPEVPTPPSGPLVFEEDKHLVTPYLFDLLNQMETCYFADQDRVGGRSKVKDCPINYPGLQCKHCAGKAGFGRYFPISIQALTSANSDRNIYNHIVKCRKCPEQVRTQLRHLQGEQQACKNRRGSRKQFFQRVWERMHGPDRKCLQVSYAPGP